MWGGCYAGTGACCLRRCLLDRFWVRVEARVRVEVGTRVGVEVGVDARVRVEVGVGVSVRVSPPEGRMSQHCKVPD